jgi:hypothetical protein
MVFKIEPQAKEDIQQEIHYYNEQQKGLGKRFHAEVKDAFKTIQKNPYFQVRYDDVRCLPLKKFPVMIHFTFDAENMQIIVRAVINTHRNPKTKWPKELP